MPDRGLPALPDPNRFGGPGWLARSGGVMAPSHCVKGLTIATQQQIANLWERITPAIRRAADLRDLPPTPDSRLVKLAEKAALEQNRELLAHGFRSAIFSRALAYIDGRQVDPELLHVCGILHDVGLMQAVAGEDFTLRSARVARKCADDAHEPAAVGEHLADALIVHTTVDVSPDRDGELGAYTQYGAMVDLTGLRLSHLPRAFVAAVLEQHPRGAFKREILRRLSLEARAVRGGLRFRGARRLRRGRTRRPVLVLTSCGARPQRVEIRTPPRQLPPPSIRCGEK